MMRRGSRLLRRLMKYSASAWGERFAALAGNRMTGTLAASLMGRTVAATWLWVTPVERPTMIAWGPRAAGCGGGGGGVGGRCVCGVEQARGRGTMGRRR